MMMIVARLRAPNDVQPPSRMRARWNDCVMENSEAIVAVKTAISICDISNGRTAFCIINAILVIPILLIFAALHDNWCFQGFICITLEYL